MVLIWSQNWLFPTTIYLPEQNKERLIVHAPSFSDLLVLFLWKNKVAPVFPLDGIISFSQRENKCCLK